MVDTVETDGRRAKRVSNRAAAVQALIELWREGRYFERTDEIAARAGLSERSLFRYFADPNELVREAMRHFMAAARPHGAVAVDPDDTLERRVERLVAVRFRQYDVIAPAYRAARAHAFRDAAFAERTSQTRARWREQVREVLGAWLTGRARALGATVDILLSFDAYETLRRDEGLSHRRAETLTVRAICAVLAT